MNKKVIVVGAGASGLMAAGTAAKNGNDVILFERNDKVGRKIMITGKGRCNVTNATFDTKISSKSLACLLKLKEETESSRFRIKRWI